MLAAAALALAPPAVASTGALDQYTEQAPTGPAGDGQGLGTGGTTGAPAGTDVPAGGGSPAASSAPSPPTASTAPAHPPTSNAGGAATAAGWPGFGDWPWEEIAIGTVAALIGPGQAHPATTEPTSSAADGTTLPLVDYPLTTLVLLPIAIGLGILAAAGGIGTYHRLRERESPPA